VWQHSFDHSWKYAMQQWQADELMLEEAEQETAGEVVVEDE